MPRFFKEFFETAPYIEGDDARHIAKSLRMRVGDKLIVCDTFGNDYDCTITDVESDRVLLKIQNKTKSNSEPSIELILFQCLTKGDKTDTIVKQAVELGVARIVPTISQNCVSMPDRKSLQKKIERWQKIADEAAGQSGRGILPKVLEDITLTEVASLIETFDKTFFCYELGAEPIEDLGGEVKSVAVIIGPEGGFSAKEAEMLKNSGAIVTTLGPRILRAETAPVVAISAIMLKSGNMN